MISKLLRQFFKFSLEIYLTFDTMKTYVNGETNG